MFFLSMKKDEIYEMLKIHTFALMKMIPCKFHGWVFSMNFQ